MKKRLTTGAKQAVTTRDIAERTGLSKMTVSRVLNNHPYVSEETRQKVMAAVSDLGFRPNTLAKRFFTGKTRLLGVIIPLEFMFSSFYFKELFQGVLECAEEAGYDILLHNSTSKKIPALDKCLDLVKGKLAEGLLLAAPMSYDTFPIQLTQEGVPLVITGESACGDKVNRVSIPNRASAHDALQRLIALGHRRIAILTYDSDHMESQERLQGCKDAFQAAGIPFEKDLVVAAHYNRREAFRAIQRIMPVRTDITAIFALNADMALGASDALRSLGLKVPDAVSLVAFDDCEEMEQIDPPISTVLQHPYKVGYGACELLLSLLSPEPRPRKAQVKLIETEFMERGSVSAAAARRGPA